MYLFQITMLSFFLIQEPTKKPCLSLVEMKPPGTVLFHKWWIWWEAYWLTSLLLILNGLIIPWCSKLILFLSVRHLLLEDILPVFLDIRHPWGLSQKGFISLVSNSFIANVLFSLPHCQIAAFTLLLFISHNTKMPKAFIYCSSPVSHLFLDLFLLC